MERHGTVLEANKRLFAHGSFRSGTPATPLRSPKGAFAVLQCSKKNGTVEKRFLSRKIVRDPPGEPPHRPVAPVDGFGKSVVYRPIGGVSLG